MLSVPGENRAPVLAVFLLLVFLMLLSAQIRFPETGARLQSGLLFLVSPVARTAVGVVEGAGDLWTGYVDLHGTWAENHKLKREVERLRLAARRSQATGEENRRLRQLLDLQQALTLRTVAARVILLNLRGPFRVAVLDRGWKDGISRDDAVITPDGVVGRITAVTGRMAKVHLIVDPSSGAAALGERSRVQGMAVGRGVNEVELRYISTLADLKPGDWVDTSGLDGIYQEGFRIGQVVKTADEEGLEERVVVRTSVDFRTLEEVLVIVGVKARPVFPDGSLGRAP